MKQLLTAAILALSTQVVAAHQLHHNFRHHTVRHPKKHWHHRHFRLHHKFHIQHYRPRHHVRYKKVVVHYGGVHDPRPAAWCGWYMRKVFHVTSIAFNRAAHWLDFGRPSPHPCAGCVVVWPHHVGRLIKREFNGEWLVNSGNDGHRIRTRPRFLRGVIGYRIP